MRYPSFLEHFPFPSLGNQPAFPSVTRERLCACASPPPPQLIMLIISSLITLAHPNRVLSIPRLQSELKHQEGKQHLSAAIQPHQEPGEVKTALQGKVKLEEREHLILQSGDKAAEAADVSGWGEGASSAVRNRIQKAAEGVVVREVGEGGIASQIPTKIQRFPPTPPTLHSPSLTKRKVELSDRNKQGWPLFTHLTRGIPQDAAHAEHTALIPTPPPPQRFHFLPFCTTFSKMFM